MTGEQPTLQANLIKVLPVVEGFNLNKAIFGGSEKLLIGLGGPLMLRYDVTLGYTGYFESTVNSTITDIINIGDNFIALSGKRIVDKSGLGQESNETSIVDASNECCIELVNLETNSLTCKFIN